MAGVDTSFYATQPTNKLQSPMEAMKDVMPVALGQQALSHDQFRQAREQIEASQQIFGAIAANPTLDAVAAGAQQLHLMGVPAPMIQQGIQEATAAAAKGGDDPAQVAKNIQSWAFDHINRHATVLEQSQAAGMAPPTLTNTGNKLQPTITQSGPNAGIYPARGAPLQLEQTPAELAAPTNYTDKTGVTTQGTRRQFQIKAGDTTGIPANQVSPGAGQGGGVAPASGIAGPPAGHEMGLKALNEDMATAASKIAGTRDLIQAIPLVEALGPGSTGPSSDAVAKLKGFLVSRGIIGENATDLAVRQEATKYLSRYVANSPVSQRSDMGQLQAQASSPNLDQSRPAILSLAKRAVAMDRMDAARTLSYPKEGAPADYPRYKGQFTQKQDDLAYRFDLLPKDQQATTFSRMEKQLASKDPQEKAAAVKFFNSLQTAHKTIFSPDGQ